MTLFGTTLDGQQVMALVSLLVALVFWIMVLRRQKQADRDLKQRLMEMHPDPKPKDKPEGADQPGSNIHRGPWG